MGATTSAQVRAWSKEEVSERVAALGPAFEQYRALVIENAVDGDILATLRDADLRTYGVASTFQESNRISLAAAAVGALPPLVAGSCSGGKMGTAVWIGTTGPWKAFSN